MFTYVLWSRLVKTLADERGQIPISDDPAPAEPPAPSDEPAPNPGTPPPTHEPEAFFDASSLAPELQGQWKKMQGAFTKAMQKSKTYRDAADLVDRFNRDPDFARQTIMQRAQQLGLSIGQPGQPGTPTPSASTPPELVEAVKANLSPELQWMAPALAASQWAGMQMALKPMKEQQQRTTQETRDQEYDLLAAQLSEKAPEWETHEDDMDNLLLFLQSPKMMDRRWGSKLDILYRAVVGDGQATAEAARRMAQAGKLRTPVGQPTATPTPNIREQVLKPKQNQEAWDIAAKNAIRELERQGIKVS